MLNQGSCGAGRHSRMRMLHTMLRCSCTVFRYTTQTYPTPFPGEVGENQRPGSIVYPTCEKASLSR